MYKGNKFWLKILRLLTVLLFVLFCYLNVKSILGVVSLANSLLAEFNIPRIIEEISDISASLFVVLYESLFSDKLTGN